MNVTCSACGAVMDGRWAGPIRELLSHWERFHGAVPTARYTDERVPA